MFHEPPCLESKVLRVLLGKACRMEEQMRRWDKVAVTPTGDSLSASPRSTHVAEVFAPLSADVGGTVGPA